MTIDSTDILIGPWAEEQKEPRTDRIQNSLLEPQLQSHGSLHGRIAGHGGLALQTADVLALHQVPVNQHDAAAAARLVPGLAAPAAVPAPVLRLERAVPSQRAAGR